MWFVHLFLDLSAFFVRTSSWYGGCSGGGGVSGNGVWFDLVTGFLRFVVGQLRRESIGANRKV